MIDLTGWNITYSHGTILNKGHVYFEYCTDICHRVRVNYYHSKDKFGTYKEAFITHDEDHQKKFEKMFNEANEIYNNMIIMEYGLFYYKSFVIEQKSLGNYAIKNNQDETLLKTFDDIKDAVNFIDEELEK